RQGRPGTLHDGNPCGPHANAWFTFWRFGTYATVGGRSTLPFHGCPRKKSACGSSEQGQWVRGSGRRHPILNWLSCQATDPRRGNSGARSDTKDIEQSSNAAEDGRSVSVVWNF